MWCYLCLITKVYITVLPTRKYNDVAGVAFFIAIITIIFIQQLLLLLFYTDYTNKI